MGIARFQNVRRPQSPHPCDLTKTKGQVITLPLALRLMLVAVREGKVNIQMAIAN